MTNIPFIVLGTIFVAEELNICCSVFGAGGFWSSEGYCLKVAHTNSLKEDTSVNYKREKNAYTNLLSISIQKFINA